MLAKLQRLLGHRRAPLFAALLAMVLVLPALGAGYMADDLVLRASLRPEFRLPGGIQGDWDMFRFQGPDRQNQKAMMDVGVWPWWSAPNLLLCFFRPLTSLWHAFDFRVLGEHPWIQHAESIALYGALVLAVARLYRRLIPSAALAGFAAVLYAADHCHAFPVTWLANRNALVGAAFGLSALVLHDRARREGDRRAGWIAPVLLAVGLLGGESAVATLAYLGAHALFLDEAPWRDRARALAPYVAVVIAWTVAYKALGYGARGSGYYIDPGGEPLVFARALLLRMPVLLLAQLTGPPADLWSLVPEARVAVPLAATCVALALVAIPLARMLRGDRLAAFFATGMVASLVPMCATWPNDRLLLFSGVGAFGLIAMFVERARQGAARGAKILAGIFVLIHAIASPLMLPGRCKQLGDLFGGYVARADATMPPMPKASTVMVLNAPDLIITNYVGVLRANRGVPMPKGERLLAIATDGNDGDLERPDARTLVITLREGFLLDSFATVARGASVPFRAGEVVRIEGMTVTVEEVMPDGRPRRVRFELDRPLEDPSLIWVTWEGKGFAPARLPAIGERAPFKALDYLTALYGR
jgi:hypothetical protein